MDKKTFIKTSALVASGFALSRFISCNNEHHMTNWAGNLTYSTDNLLSPQNVTELQSIIKQSGKLKALGSRHSFNNIADSNAQLVSSSELRKEIFLDTDKKEITVNAGMKYGELCTYLDEKGFALHNLASLPHISIAGACATATHGSGMKNGNLAVAVTGLEMINAAGDIVKLTREKDGDEFAGAVVSLGALGFVTKMTLALQPTFQMKQWVYQDMPMAELEKNFEAIMSAGYSVSLFTDWKNKNINQVWIKSKLDAPDAKEFYGAKAATKNLHPLTEMSAVNCTDQMGVPGHWYERMPHFKMGFTPSSGKELQSEYFIPFEYAYEGLKAIERLNDKVSPHLFISEIRAIAADDLWMSPFYQKTCVAFHFTWKQEWDAVQKLLPLIEDALAPFNARPHWGKLFSIEPSILQKRIVRLNDFKSLIEKYDPKGKFRNQFLYVHLF